MPLYTYMRAKINDLKIWIVLMSADHLREAEV